MLTVAFNMEYIINITHLLAGNICLRLYVLKVI